MRATEGKQGEANPFYKMETAGGLFCCGERRSHFLMQVGLKLTV